MKKYDFHIHTSYSDGNSSLERVIQTAIDHCIEKIAVTDHMSALGHFLYTVHNPIQSIEQYLSEIARMRLKYEHQIEIYPGAEISEDFIHVKPSSPLEDRLQDNLEFFSLFLIETILIAEPIRTALNMRKYLDDQGFEHVPVILAHPNFSQIDFATFHLLLNKHIGVELNESKLSDRQATYFVDHVKSLTPQQRCKLFLSFGSDAHVSEEIGSVDYVTTIIEENQLWKNVITPPRVQDFILS